MRGILSISDGYCSRKLSSAANPGGEGGMEAAPSQTESLSQEVSLPVSVDVLPVSASSRQPDSTTSVLSPGGFLRYKQFRRIAA